MNWKHKDIWRFTDEKTFTVEVSRHQVEVPEGGCYDSDLGHRWCVYAYIYPTHPHFEKFDDSDRMWQDAASAMPFHGGPSYLHRHMKMKDGKPVPVSIQVGADYNHDGDWQHTRNATQEDAHEVFADAERLVNWLQGTPTDETD